MTLIIVPMCVLALAANIQLVKAEPKTWIVDDDSQADFHTINEAINASQNGDTVLVKPGIYCENVFVDKMITLIAENHSAVIKSVTENVGSAVRIIAKKATITGFTIQGGAAGVFLHGKKDIPVEIVVMGNIITGCIRGVFVYWSNGSLVTENVLKYNMEGIYGYWSSARITRNIIENNSYGISFFGRRSSIICENVIQNNNYGIFIQSSELNRFFHNNLVNNSCSAYVEGELENLLDDGYHSCGNYWSDYNGEDMGRGEDQSESGSDGVGDTPYVIDDYNRDNYPLMGMFSSFNTSLGNHVNVISNFAIEDFECFESNGTIKLYISNMTVNQTYGFCRLTIPHDLLSPPYNVTINNNLVSYTTLYENDKLSIIYFSYEHPTSGITIKFLLLIIISLITMATLLAAIVYRRKRNTACVEIIGLKAEG